MQLPPRVRGAGTIAAGWVARATELYKYSIGLARARSRQRSGLLSRHQHAADKQQKNAILNDAGVIVTLRAIE